MRVIKEKEVKNKYIGIDTYSSESNYDLTEEQEKKKDEKLRKKIFKDKK